MPKPVRNGGRNGADPAGGAGDDDDEDDAPVTRGELTALVNAAVTTQVGRKLAPLKQQIDSLPAMVTEGVTAAVTAAFSANGQGQQRQAAPGAQQGKDAAAGAQESPQMVEMRQQLEQLQGKLKAQETANEAAQRRVREGERDNAITGALSTHGVDKARLRGAALVLRESLVAIKDKDAPGGERYVYRVKRDGFEDDLDIGAGVAEWVKTDEGKSYLAPTQAARGGAGTRQAAGAGAGQQAGSGRGVPQDPKEAKAAKKQAALDTLVSSIQGSIVGGTVELGD